MFGVVNMINIMIFMGEIMLRYIVVLVSFIVFISPLKENNYVRRTHDY